MEVAGIAVGVAHRGAHLDGHQPGPPLAAAPEEARPGEARDAVPCEAVVVAEAEAGLPVAHQQGVAGRPPELELLEAQQVPVMVRRVVHEANPAGPPEDPEAAGTGQDDLVGPHLVGASARACPPDPQWPTADVVRHRREAEPDPAAGRRHRESARGALVEVREEELGRTVSPARRAVTGLRAGDRPALDQHAGVRDHGQTPGGIPGRLAGAGGDELAVDVDAVVERVGEPPARRECGAAAARDDDPAADDDAGRSDHGESPVSRPRRLAGARCHEPAADADSIGCRHGQPPVRRPRRVVSLGDALRLPPGQLCDVDPAVPDEREARSVGRDSRLAAHGETDALPVGVHGDRVPRALDHEHERPLGRA